MEMIFIVVIKRHLFVLISTEAQIWDSYLVNKWIKMTGKKAFKCNQIAYGSKDK